MRPLQEQLKDYFAALSERDRRALRVGAFTVAAILVVASTATVVSNSQAAVDRVEKKRALLVDLPAARDRSERLQRLGACRSVFRNVGQARHRQAWTYDDC